MYRSCQFQHLQRNRAVWKAEGKGDRGWCLGNTKRKRKRKHGNRSNCSNSSGTLLQPVSKQVEGLDCDIDEGVWIFKKVMAEAAQAAQAQNAWRIQEFEADRTLIDTLSNPMSDSLSNRSRILDIPFGLPRRLLGISRAGHQAIPIHLRSPYIGYQTSTM